MVARKLILAIAALALVLVALMSAVFIFLPEWLALREVVNFPTATTDHQLEFLSATRASTATLLGGAFTALTALTAIGTVYASYSAYLSSQDKQLADTLAKATELLGSHEVSTRIGGIYVLRRMADTSAKDSSIAAEIVSAHVRSLCANDSRSTVTPDRLPTHSMDVQIMLDFLGGSRQAHNQRIVDLSNVLLHRITLERRAFRRTNFTRSQFISLTFKDADLRESDLSGCVFTSCCFEGAQLAGAQLNDSAFNNSTGLTQAQIDGAKGNRQVLLPGHLNLPREWMDL